MHSIRLQLLLVLTGLIVLPVAAQTPAPTSGEITVRLIEGMDSSTDPKAMSHGEVTKSTNPAVPKGSAVLVGLGSDPVNGGYTAKLLQLTIGGKTVPAASSAVVLAPDVFNKAFEATRAAGQPKDSASGTRVFLPAKMIVRFTLMPPPAESAVQRRPEPIQDTKPKGWTVENVAEVADNGADVKQNAAILVGSVRYRGRSTNSFLLMHCDFPTKSYPGLLPLEMILGANPEMLSAPGAPGMPVDVSDSAQSQLGNSTPIHVSAIGQNRTTGGRLRFFYDATDMRAIVDGAGQSLRLSLAGAPGAEPDTLVTFALPEDNSAVKQTMQTCLQKSEDEANALKARTILSCPSQPGKSLNIVDVLYADTGKSVDGNRDEMSNSASWTFASATKTKPARKRNLACYYFDNGANSQTPSVLKFAIPSTVTSCEFVQKTDADRSFANCYTGDSTKPASVATTAPNSPVSAGKPTPLQSKFQLRGIYPGMTFDQVLAIAQKENMTVTEQSATALAFQEPTVVHNVQGGGMNSGSGLAFQVRFSETTHLATVVQVSQIGQGDLEGALVDKWGKGLQTLTMSNQNASTACLAGTGSLKRYGKIAHLWGDCKTIHAEYYPASGNYFTGVSTVAIIDPVLSTPPPLAKPKL